MLLNPRHARIDSISLSHFLFVTTDILPSSFTSILFPSSDIDLVCSGKTIMMMFYLVTVLLAIANLGLSASGRSTSSCAVPTQTPGAYSFRPTTDSESVCLELKAAISGVNGTLTPSDGASYEDFEDQN